MNDYLGGMSREDLEIFVRRLIEHGSEGLKLDFKKLFNLQTTADKAEFAKDVSSIANTDDEHHFDDYGYIVFGAERGVIVGGLSEMEAQKIDKFQAHLTNVLKEFLAPVPAFSLWGFNDAAQGSWGVIVIPPSNRQPHMFIRDATGVGKHEWWVRINDTKERASVLDYARVLEKATSRAVRPLERELQRIALKVEAGGSTAGLDAILGALRAVPSGGDPAATESPSLRAQGEAVGVVRRHLVTGAHRVEDELVAEALRVVEIMTEDRPQNPWNIPVFSVDTTLPILEYLEQRARPLVEALATIARYDDKQQLTGAVERAFRAIAHEPRAPGSFTDRVVQLRLYPLALCLYGVTMVAIAERRVELLRAVLDLKLRRENGDGTDPIVVALRRIWNAGPIFNGASGQKHFEPVAERAKAVVVPWLSSLLAGSSGNDLFFLSEFVLGLAYLRVSEQGRNAQFPLPGTYFYYWDARRAIVSFLEQRPDWLQTVLGEPLETLLPSFDQSATSVRDRDAFGMRGGFVTGAMDAYGQKPR